MPRYRKLYVKTVESQDLEDMPNDTYRLLWVLLPLQLCREGRGVDNPAWVKSKVFPLRQDISRDDIIEMMDWFAERKMIIRYEVADRRYFYIPTFHTYQGNTTKEAESIYPPPISSLQSNSRVTPEQVKPNGENIDTASASEYMNNESAYYEYMQSYNTAKAVDCYRQITGLPDPPAKSIDEVITNMQIAVDMVGSDTDRLIEEGKQEYKIWCNRKTKNGFDYSRTNPAWIERLINRLAEKPKIESKSEPELSDEEAERIRLEQFAQVEAKK